MRNKLLALAAVACILVLPALAAPAPVKDPVKTTDAFPTNCPVNGEIIETASQAADTSVYQGKTYYFCCERHKTEFDADPTQYVKLPAKSASGR